MILNKEQKAKVFDFSYHEIKKLDLTKFKFDYRITLEENLIRFVRFVLEESAVSVLKKEDKIK
jgi:hypothetical protein